MLNHLIQAKKIETPFSVEDNFLSPAASVVALRALRG
jgi:hypothetical protein